jgi:hypothetical protein
MAGQESSIVVTVLNAAGMPHRLATARGRQASVSQIRRIADRAMTFNAGTGLAFRIC